MFGTKNGRIESELAQIGTLLNNLATPNEPLSQRQQLMISQIKGKVAKLSILSNSIHDLIDKNL
jgi:hypothetical protein